MKYANISIEKGFSQSEHRVGAEVVRKINIGDYAQILAIDYLYEMMGISQEEIVYIEYYDLFDYDGEYVVLPINFIFFNAYYGERDLLLSPKIIPVFLGIHAINGSYNDREVEYFRRYSPVGCRDAWTLSIFREKNIDAYLQGCITTVFPKRELNSASYQNIYFVDIPKSLEVHIPSDLSQKSIRLSQEIYGDIALWLQNEQCGTIKEYMSRRLDEYRDHAALVVTSRLHCAIPCMAMGIPTIFACEEYAANYTWVERLMPIYTPESFEAIDWNPKIVEYETLKHKVLTNAQNRIRNTFNEYFDRCEISDFFEVKSVREYKDAYTWRLEKYAKTHWSSEQEFKYIVWGVTQITDEICSYMDKEYPKAVLTAVIDDYRDIIYKGLAAIKSEEIPKYADCYFIATGNSSSSAAQKKFAKLGWMDKLCTVFGTNYNDIDVTD